MTVTINSLPDELLIVIFDEALRLRRSNSMQPIRSLYEMPLMLTNVSRRFHRLALPRLYAVFQINCCGTREAEVNYTELSQLDGWNIRELEGNRQLTWRSTQLLHRSLLCNPALRRLCTRRLIIRYVPDAECQQIARDFVMWCTAAKSLAIGFLQFKGDLSLLQLAQRHMVGVEQLALSRVYSWYYAGETPKLLHAVPYIRGFSRLRTLELGSLDLNACQVLKGQAGMAPFTELRISSYMETSEQPLFDLIKWPFRLESFGLADTNCESRLPDSRILTLNTLHPPLSLHQQTLHTIDIRDLCSIEWPINTNQTVGLDGFDLRPFTALTHLTLSCNATGTSLALLHHLLAPRLRIFRWDLKDAWHGDDAHCLGDLDEDEENWLRALAHTVMDSSSTGGTTDLTSSIDSGERPTRLERIELLYMPTTRYIRNGCTFDDPWKRVKRLIAGAMGRAGIELCWEELTVSKEESETAREAFRKENEGGVE